MADLINVCTNTYCYIFTLGGKSNRQLDTQIAIVILINLTFFLLRTLDTFQQRSVNKQRRHYSTKHVSCNSFEENLLLRLSKLICPTFFTDTKKITFAHAHYKISDIFKLLRFYRHCSQNRKISYITGAAPPT